MKQTEHYQLNQWEANDKVQRTDFNADNAKIDAALGQMLHFIHGSYIGTGESAKIHYSIGARPKVLIMTCNNYYDALNPTTRLLFAVENMDVRFFSDNNLSTSVSDIAAFDSDGFTLDHSLGNVDLGLNRSGCQIDYWVLY